MLQKVINKDVKEKLNSPRNKHSRILAGFDHFILSKINGNFLYFILIKMDAKDETAFYCPWIGVYNSAVTL